MPNKTKFDLKMNIKKYENKLLSVLKKRMNTVMVSIVAYVKQNFGPSNLGGTNPSAPGDTPNIGIGTLRNSISFKVKQDGKEIVGVYGVISGPAKKYARRLELGYWGKDAKGRNVRQLPRPYLVPAYQNNKRQIKRILTKGL